MGFEETHNDLFDAGVRDDRFALIAKMDEESLVKVKTPCGPTEQFELKEIIQQGSVFGPLKCSVQIDTIGRDCLIEDEGLYKYKNAVRIPPLAMIDDVLAVTKCGIDSLEVNSLINMKIEAKKLRLSDEKCIFIHVGKSCDTCDNNLKVHEKNMKKKHIGTYLGEIITSDGKLDETVDKRRSKGVGILSQITGIISSVSFGFHYFNISFTLRESMLLNGMLFNCEAWNYITEKQLEILEEVDLMMLRKVMKTNVKTAKESLFLESGCLPIRFVIAKRILMFLWNILKRDKKEMIRKVYEVQKVHGMKDDWAETVRMDILEYDINLSDEIISKMSKNMFKNLVDKAVKQKATEYLNKKAESHSKSQHLMKINLVREKYFESDKFSRSDVELLFSLRTRMIDVRKNFPSKYNNQIGCRLCMVQVEDQKHILKCEKLVARVKIPVDIEYEDIFKSVEKQKEILKVFKELLRTRELLLNTSHQTNDGPDARVHQDHNQEDSVAANNFGITVINDVIINVVK